MRSVSPAVSTTDLRSSRHRARVASVALAGPAVNDEPLELVRVAAVADLGKPALSRKTRSAASLAPPRPRPRDPVLLEEVELRSASMCFSNHCRVSRGAV